MGGRALSRLRAQTLGFNVFLFGARDDTLYHLNDGYRWLDMDSLFLISDLMLDGGLVMDGVQMAA